MAYSLVADVKKFFPNWTTAISDADVTAEWIVKADALIDATLRPFYTVPITNATDLVLMESISARLTAAELWEILFAERAAGGNLNEPGASEMQAWRQQARDMLDGIVSGRLKLVTGRTAKVDEGVYVDYDDLVTTTVNPLALMNKEW